MTSQCSIEHFPPEILQLLFVQLNLKDLGNCSKTCVRWKLLIVDLFKNKGRIVIATGLPEDKGHKTEVLDLINPSQKFNFLEDIPSRWGSAGGLVQNKPMIAGGYVFDTYFQDYFVIGDYENKKTMVYERFASSSIVLNNCTLWVVGGHDGYLELSSTEFISMNKPPVQGPGLPFTISWHTMVQYDSESIFIIGGKQDGQTTPSNRTMIVNPKDNFKAKPGPSLIQARAYHCSAIMEINGENHIVVAGGDISSSTNQRSVYLDSVELLNPLSGKGWQKGPKLPFKLSQASMVTSPTGRGVVIIGGWNENSKKYSTSLFELDGRTMEWVKLKQKLEHGRVGHISFPIPDDLPTLKDYEEPKSGWQTLKKKLPKILNNLL